MRMQFLGSGSAWCVPEHGCPCMICSKMRERGEQRLRTSLLVEGSERLLIDCGPDLQRQMVRFGLQRPDAILITHEHGDHFLGLDELLAFRRVAEKDQWTRIPVYATEIAWQSIEARFGYLLGSLLEKRLAIPGEPLEALNTRVVPFDTYHGPSAQGSVGYLLELRHRTGDMNMVYTSDFSRLDGEPDFLARTDLLVIQAHWLNEPEFNRPNHMSFERAIEYIRRWNPAGGTYLVHLSESDQVPGDPCNSSYKKLAPLSPLKEPSSGRPYPIPTCQEEWQEVVDRICRDYRVPGPVTVAYDGLSVEM